LAAVYHHSHVRWIHNHEGGGWHGLDEETGMPLCSSDVPESSNIYDSLPPEVIERFEVDVIESGLCAACARVVKLHRG
jgi:hypothetical protein